MTDKHSFDMVSKVDFSEVDNAINLSQKEIVNRYDLKDSESELKFVQSDEKINLESSDEYKLKAIYEILKLKLAKRNVSIKSLTLGKIEGSLGGRVKQEIKIQQGLSQEKAKEIAKDIKTQKLKVQIQIQNDAVRVSGKKIDDLQATMQFLKEKEYDFLMQFENYR